MSKILIIGGAGFCGGNLAVYFAKQGHEILVMDNLVRRGSELNLERFKQYKDKITFIHGDARCKEDFESFNYFKPNAVLDCSAQTTIVKGYENPIFDFQNNTVATINILEFCRKHDAGIIFWSSNKSYPDTICNDVPTIEKETRIEWNPYSDFQKSGWSKKGFTEILETNHGGKTIYGATKSASEQLIMEWSNAFGIPSIINRFSCLYGENQWGIPNQGWITWFCIARSFGIPLTVYGWKGKQVRDCLYIDDLISLIEKQVFELSKYHGIIYNVGGGYLNTISILELNNKLDKLVSKESQISFEDKPRPRDQQIYISDITKVSEELRWSPQIDIDRGLKNILEWIRINSSKLEALYL